MSHDETTTNPPALCPACRSGRTAPAFSKRGYRHFRCLACGTLFVFPIPSAAEIAALYQERSGEQTSAACWTASRSQWWPFWDWTLGQVRQMAGEGPLLDVGCGGGQFLEFAQRRGWSELAGLELAGEAARQARERTGLEILEVPLEQAALPGGRYAGIMMWDVIEHLADMRGMLREVRRLLRPGGVFVLSSVNCRGVALRLLGARALVVTPPEHLIYFSTRGFRALLETESFEVRTTLTRDIFLREWLSLIRKPSPGPSAAAAGGLKQDRQSSPALQGLFLAAMGAANKVLNLAGLGDEMVAVVRKPE